MTTVPQDVIVAPNLTDGIGKRLSTGWWSPRLSSLRVAFAFPPSLSPGPRLLPDTPGGVPWGFSFQCMEQLTEGGKRWSESRQKKCGLADVFCLAWMLCKKFLNHHIKERYVIHRKSRFAASLAECWDLNYAGTEWWASFWGLHAALCSLTPKISW